MRVLPADGPHQRNVPVPPKIAVAAMLPGAENESEQPDFRPGSGKQVSEKEQAKWKKFLNSQRTYGPPAARRLKCRDCNAEFESNNELHRHVDITHGKSRQAKKKQEAAEQAIDALVNCYAAMAMEDAEETNQELNQPKEEDRLAESTIENDSCDYEPSGFYHLEDGTEELLPMIGCEKNPAENDIQGLASEHDIQREGQEWDYNRLLLLCMSQEVLDTGPQEGRSTAEPGAEPNSPSLFHLSEQKRLAEGDGPPTERHSVATVPTWWKTDKGLKEAFLTLSDTGCNTTAMRETNARRILAASGGKMWPARAGDRLQAAKGDPFVAIGCAYLTCWVNDSPMAYWYTIYPDDLPYAVVWGTNIMKHFGMSFDFGTMSVTFGTVNLRISEVKQRRTDPILLTMLEAVTLKPREQRLVYMFNKDVDAVGRVGRVTALQRRPGETIKLTAHEGVTTAHANGAMQVYLTNTTQSVKTLAAGEAVAEWTRIGGGIAEGLEENLAATTMRTREELRLHLLEATARECWEELNQAETESRHDDSEATSSGVQDSDFRKAAHGGASSTFRKEPDKRQQADTARRQPFTDLPSEECLSAPVDGMETLPPDPPPGSSREVIRAAFETASKALMDCNPGDEGPWGNKIGRLMLALAKADVPGSRANLKLPECLNLDDTLQHLSPEDRELVRASLTTQADFFATQQYPKRISGMEPIEIDTGSHQPVCSRYRQLNPSQQATVNDYVEKLLDAGIVEPGDGPWSSPLQVVPKADGKWRPVVDLRRVNKLVTRDSYPMPLVEETINRISGSTWISKIDLQSAFFSLPLAMSARDKTAFMTGLHGLLRFTALPMGLTTAPQKFQRAVDTALGALQTTCCVSFFDDICVYSNGDLKDHMAKCESVMAALRTFGFTANTEKCLFAQTELDFLGHTVSREGIRMQEKKVSVMLNYPRPTSQKELLSFLALTSYYRKFMSNYAHTAAPLYELMQDDEDYRNLGGPQSRKQRMRVVWDGTVWTKEHDQAFRTLKGALITAPVLAMPTTPRRAGWRGSGRPAGIRKPSGATWTGLRRAAQRESASNLRPAPGPHNGAGRTRLSCGYAARRCRTLPSTSVPPSPSIHAPTTVRGPWR